VSRVDELVDQLAPEGVPTKTVSSLAKYVRGLTYAKSDESPEGPIRVLRGNNITLSTNTLNFNDVKVVSSRVRVRDDQYLKANDILISAASGSKAHVGKVAFVESDLDYCFGGFMAVLRTTGEVLPRFLFHLLVGHSFSAYLANTLDSTTINNLSASVMGGFRVPVPPLEVQQEIVRILDNFTALEAELEAELEARRVQHAHFRDSMLAANSSEGSMVKLDQVVEITIGFPFKSRQFSDDDADVALVRGDNIGQGSMKGRGFKRWKRTSHDGLHGYELSQGDVVLAMDRPWIPAGLKWATISGDVLPALLVQRVARLRSALHELDQRYLATVISSAAFTRHILDAQTGNTVPHISGRQIGSFQFPLPSLSDQRRIVSALESLDALVNDLSIGLPAELAARRKQYEYYREKLLTFEELV
jgi:type I restriction enzyme S subunit